MQGDVVKAAKWLGGCMIAASLILVFGFHPAVTSHTIRVTKVQPEGQYFSPEAVPVSPVVAPTVIPNYPATAANLSY